MIPERPPWSAKADPTRYLPVGHTRAERWHLGTIERRIAWLDLMLEREPEVRMTEFRRHEREALMWALRRIADAERAENTQTGGEAVPVAPEGCDDTKETA